MVQQSDSQSETRAADEPAFVSHQVSDARRYYLNLSPSPDAGLAVVCGGVERMRADYVVERESFPFIGIELVTEGAGELYLDTASYSLSPGVLFAYGPDTKHRIQNRPPERMRKFYVDIAGREAPSLARQVGLLGTAPLRVTRIHELVELFEMLDREARSDSDLAGDVCESLMRLMFAKIRQSCVAEKPGIPRSYATYERIRKHIDEHFLRLRSIEDVAAECDVTPIHLSRLFRRFGGVGAYRFLMRKKMNFAAELLLEEGMLVKDAATALGFSDAFQFSRAFKRVYGIPPKRLMQSSAAQKKMRGRA